MDESDRAFAELLRLQQTLTGARGRLTDLVLLLEAQGPPPRASGPAPAVPGGEPAESPPAEDLVDVLPPVEELCARAAEQAVPEPLVLPAEVRAPSVVVPTEAAPADPVLTSR